MNKGNKLVEILDFFDVAKNYRNLQYNLIKNYIRGSILEVGGGNGKLIEPFFNSNNKISICEIDKEFFLNLKKKFLSKAKIYNCRIQKIRSKYDTIIYGDVLEHIKNDKKEILCAVSKLKLNGTLIIIVPAFNFLFSQFDKDVGHYRRYKKEFFLDFAEKNNLIIEKITYFDSIGFVILILNKIFPKKTSFGNKLPILVYFWDKLIFFSKFFDLLLGKFFGKSLLIIIKKI